MRGVNKVILVGTLGADPDTRYTQSGKAVTNVSMATSEYWTDKNTGERKENTEWHQVVFFNRLAEVAGEYLSKGSKIYVEGKLQTEKWQDKNGIDRYTPKIMAGNMQMLDGKQESAPQSRPVQSTQAPAQSPPPQTPDMIDDDIPF